MPASSHNRFEYYISALNDLKDKKRSIVQVRDQNKLLQAWALLQLDEDGACQILILYSVTRGRGYGAAVLKKAENMARFLGCSCIWLHAEDEAVAFYLHLGWRQRTDRPWILYKHLWL